MEVDVAGCLLLVVGGATEARHAIARLEREGAQVRLVSPETAVELLRQAATNDGLRGVDGVVWASAAEAEIARIHARSLGLPFYREAPVRATPAGHVALVGGGPGDVELITVAGMRALAMADVVLHDRLAPAEVLARYAPQAELVDVGKTPGHHAVPQREIEQIMLAHAARGRRVVRLKGGDPFVFGRGGEEVLACRDAGVPVTVVPGVTSAIAVPASANIPVTHRDVARSFTVVSGHVPLDENELAGIVGLGGTVVVLMGVNTLRQLIAGLRRHGMPDGTPIAILERGFSDTRRSTLSTVGGIEHELAPLHPSSPAVIVIGDVVHAVGGSDWDEIELLATPVSAVAGA